LKATIQTRGSWLLMHAVWTFIYSVGWGPQHHQPLWMFIIKSNSDPMSSHPFIWIIWKILHLNHDIGQYNNNFMLMIIHSLWCLRVNFHNNYFSFYLMSIYLGHCLLVVQFILFCKNGGIYLYFYILTLRERDSNKFGLQLENKK